MGKTKIYDKDWEPKVKSTKGCKVALDIISF